MKYILRILDPLSANFTKFQTHSNNCLSVFDHFAGLGLKRLKTKTFSRDTNILPQMH